MLLVKLSHLLAAPRGSVPHTAMLKKMVFLSKMLQCRK